MDNRPIGLLDSGLGGLTVLKKVMKKLPNEATVFIGDQAHMPYGDKTTEEVIELTRRSVNFLLSKNVKVIIFACNTATAAAMEVIQKEITPQIIGVIQSGSLAAARTTKNNKVAVIGTHVTIESHAYSREIKFRNPDIEVTELATPQLAPLVEAQRDYAYNIDVVRDSLDSLKEKEFDTMILGCTHYPIIEKEISKVVGSTIKLVDPADQVAQYTENVLKRDGMLAGKKGKREYYTTGDCQKFTEIARKWLDDPELVATHVETGEDL